MTAKNWTPPPKMPDNLPPLPIGRNGKPLVYLGIGGKFIRPEGKKHSAIFLNEYTKGWEWCDNLEMDDSESNYAAESDSEVCRLNQWGDYDPRNKPKVSTLDEDLPHLLPEAQKEPVKAAQSSTLQTYLEAIESAIEEAEKEWQKAVDVAAAWAEELNARRKIRDCLQGESALTRRAWYMAGRKDERHHAKIRTNFPLYP